MRQQVNLRGIPRTLSANTFGKDGVYKERSVGSSTPVKRRLPLLLGPSMMKRSRVPFVKAKSHRLPQKEVASHQPQMGESNHKSSDLPGVSDCSDWSSELAKFLCLGRSKWKTCQAVKTLTDGCGLPKELSITPEKASLFNKTVALVRDTVRKFDLIHELSSLATKKDSEIFLLAANELTGSLTKLYYKEVPDARVEFRCRSAPTTLKPEVFDLFMYLFSIDGSERSAIGEMLTNGSPLGILNPIPYSQYWPTASKEKVDNNVRAVFNNYSSVRCNESVATEKILQEVDEGRMKLLSCSEIPSRSFAPMAMVVKGNAPSNEADRCPEHYRLIEDYRRSLLNKKIHLNQTTSLPKLRDVLFIASRLVGSDHTIQAVGLDIAGAFRHIPVAPQEAHLLNVKTSKVAAQHLVLPFGLKCSPFLFARPSGLAFRLIKAIITLMFSELLALMLLYVDDLLHLFATQATNQSGEPEAVLLLLWLTYGFKFQLHKLSLYDNPIKFTGFMLHLNDPKAGEITMKVPENKIQKAIEDLRSLRQQARVNLNTVEKMCGKLMWMCNLLPHLKSHLAPFYGSIAYMKRHGLRSMDPGHEMKQTINLWLRILTDHRFPKGLHVRPLIDEHRLVLASCDASLDGVGGCIWMKGQTYWFAQRLSGLSSKMRQEVLSSAKRATSSNMVTLELLAALITLSFIAEMSTEDRVPVMLMVDNQAAIGVLKKLYSKVPILRKLLLVALPSFATVLQGYEVCHVKSSENKVADAMYGLEWSFRGIHCTQLRRFCQPAVL